MISKEATKRKGIAIPFIKDVLATERHITANAKPKSPKPKNKKLSSLSPVKYFTIGFISYNLKNFLFIL